MSAIVEPSVAQGYAPPRDCYDEMASPDGGVREHWRQCIDALAAFGPAELEGHRGEVRRLLRDSGVTYNVYGIPNGLNRPWQLDPIPLLISNEEWNRIESGLAQRAELLNLVLCDLYGPRELIRKGLLPAELVYAHRGFLRPCDQIQLPGPRQLVLYAADLARAPNGQMWVLSDRIQAPSGAGYALANRRVLSQVFPGLFRESQVHRLANFFSALRASLNALAAPENGDPRVVVLTPGARNETYFEHGYLASYMGYTLVEGSDLTVRDGRVWLQSLSGLEPVDVILRRVDDSFCDPLELRQDSYLGTPGLVEAVRRGQVSIANPLGSSVIENPALMAFMPRIAEYFLGQSLELPSAATWWCGQPIERDYVLANLENLVIKPIFRRARSGPVFGPHLSRDECESWRARIRAKPHLYLGQEVVSFSSAPALVDGTLEPHHAILRTFLVAQGDAYVTMPGGLTRVAAEPGMLQVSNQAGGISKDTWVLAAEPEKQVSLWLQSSSAAETCYAASLPSRAAENLFWVGRYAERAEQVIRLLRNVLSRLDEHPVSDAEQQCLCDLLRALTHVTTTYPGFVGPGAERALDAPEPELLGLIVDTRRTGTTSAELQNLLQAAYSVREVFPADIWQVFNELEEELLLLQRQTDVGLDDVQRGLGSIIKTLLALAGLSMESMFRGLEWRFMDTGRRLERALKLVSLMRTTLVPARDPAVEGLILEAVLSTTESLTTYRQRYRARLDMNTVLDLLLMDDSNPRSLCYQLDRLREHVAALPRLDSAQRLSEEERMVLDASTVLRVADIEQLAQLETGSAVRQSLDQLLARLSELLSNASEAIARSHFVQMQISQQLLETQSDDEL